MSVSSGETYILINKKSDTALDLSGGDGESIIGFDNHGGENQRWTLNQEEDGSWTLQNVGSGKYLGVDGGSGEYGDGTRVLGQDYPTHWDIWPDEEDGSVHRLFVRGTRLNIDLSDHGNPTPGTPVELWGKWGGDNQCWRFIPT